MKKVWKKKNHYESDIINETLRRLQNVRRKSNYELKKLLTGRRKKNTYRSIKKKINKID